MKIIKLYGWEKAFIDKVQAIRGKELANLRKINYLLCGLQVLWSLSPFLVSFITFATYVALPGNILTAQKAFVSLALFNILRFPLVMLPNLVTSLITVISIKNRCFRNPKNPKTHCFFSSKSGKRIRETSKRLPQL